MKNELLLTIRALSDMNRLRIFFALGACDELCACQMIAMLNLSGASVSRHLRVLVDADLLKSQKIGRWILFRLKRENPILEPWLTFLQTQTRTMEIFTEDLAYLQANNAQNVLEICNRREN